MFKVHLNVLKHASFVYSVCGPSAFYSGPSFPTLFFFVLTQCDGCLDDTVWGLMAGLWGLPPMGADHCRGAHRSQWRSPAIPGTHLLYAVMLLLVLTERVNLTTSRSAH